MGKFYWLFIVGFCALLAYAGATGNFGILPKLPFDLPSKHRLVPNEPMMSTYILGSTSTGFTYPANLTVAELQEQAGASGADVAWSRTADNLGWLLTVSGLDDMTNKDVALVFRIEYRANGAPSGGPISVITDITYNGEYLDDYSTQAFLQQTATDLRSRRDMLRQGNPQ